VTEFPSFSFQVHGPRHIGDSPKSGFELEWLFADIIFETENYQEVKPLNLLLHSELMGFYLWLIEVEFSIKTLTPVIDYEFIEPIRVSLIHMEDVFLVELWFLYLYEDTSEHRKARLEINSTSYIQMRSNLELYLMPGKN